MVIDRMIGVFVTAIASQGAKRSAGMYRRRLVLVILKDCMKIFQSRYEILHPGKVNVIWMKLYLEQNSSVSNCHS